MKRATKFWIGITAAAGGIAAWLKWKDPLKVAASRVVSPGYSSRTNVFMNGVPGTLYVYPIGIMLGGFMQKTSRSLFVPVDESKPGVWIA